MSRKDAIKRLQKLISRTEDAVYTWKSIEITESELEALEFAVKSLTNQIDSTH